MTNQEKRPSSAKPGGGLPPGGRPGATPRPGAPQKAGGSGVRPPTPARPPAPGNPTPRPQGGAAPRPASSGPARPAPRISTPAERAREDELFREAGLESTQATAEGKDPEAAASILARKHGHAVVRLMAGAFARGGDPDLLAAKRVANNLFDKGARLVEIFARAKPRNDKVVERCARLIAEVGGAEGLKRLKALAKDAIPAVRVAAFEGLSRGLDADALSNLCRETLNEDEVPAEVKIAAAEALGEARAIGASAVCAKAIRDSNPDVRKAASRALARMGAGAVPGILEDVRARGQPAIGLVVDSIRALIGGGGLEDVPPELLEQVRRILSSALRDQASPVRWAAALALGVVGGKDELPALDDAITFEKDEMTKANMECARTDLKKRVV